MGVAGNGGQSLSLERAHQTLGVSMSPRQGVQGQAATAGGGDPGEALLGPNLSGQLQLEFPWDAWGDKETCPCNWRRPEQRWAAWPR